MPNRLWGRRRSDHVVDDLDRVEREISVCCDRVPPPTGCSDEAREEDDSLLISVERRAGPARRELADNDTVSTYETVPSSPNLSVLDDDSNDRLLMVVAGPDLARHELADSTASLMRVCGDRHDHDDGYGRGRTSLGDRSTRNPPLTSAYIEKNSGKLLMLPLPQGRIFVRCKELEAYNIVIFTEDGVDKRYSLRDIVYRIANGQACDKIETRIVEHWLKLVADERHRNESISVTTNAMLALFVTVGALLCTLLVSCVFQVVPAVKALLARKQA